MADYARPIPEHEKWGFKSIYRLDYIVSCPLCHALVLEDKSEDSKEDTSWWAHIQWHRLIQDNDSTFGFHWPFQPAQS